MVLASPHLFASRRDGDRGPRSQTIVGWQKGPRAGSYRREQIQTVPRADQASCARANWFRRGRGWCESLAGARRGHRGGCHPHTIARSTGELGASARVSDESPAVAECEQRQSVPFGQDDFSGRPAAARCNRGLTLTRPRISAPHSSERIFAAVGARRVHGPFQARQSALAEGIAAAPVATAISTADRA